MRVGPSTVLVTGLEALKTVYGPGNRFAKAREYEAFDLIPGLPYLFSVREEKLHAQMRRRVAKAVT